MSAPAKQETVWWLAKASKYRRNHEGDFSPASAMSRHSFGWDRNEKCFVFENDFGSVLRPSRQTMPMPVELAEKFLLRCKDADFRRRMLSGHFSTAESVHESIEHDGFVLEVRRTRDASDALQARPPSLLLALRSNQPHVSFVLFSEMREALGKAVAKVPERVIRRQLRS